MERIRVSEGFFGDYTWSEPFKRSESIQGSQGFFRGSRHITGWFHAFCAVGFALSVPFSKSSGIRVNTNIYMNDNSNNIIIIIITTTIITIITITTIINIIMIMSTFHLPPSPRKKNSQHFINQSRNRCLSKTPPAGTPPTVRPPVVSRLDRVGPGWDPLTHDVAGFHGSDGGTAAEGNGHDQSLWSHVLLEVGSIYPGGFGWFLREKNRWGWGVIHGFNFDAFFFGGKNHAIKVDAIKWFFLSLWGISLFNGAWCLGWCHIIITVLGWKTPRGKKTHRWV